MHPVGRLRPLLADTLRQFGDLLGPAPAWCTPFEYFDRIDELTRETADRCDRDWLSVTLYTQVAWATGLGPTRGYAEEHQGKRQGSRTIELTNWARVTEVRVAKTGLISLLAIP